VYSDVAELYWKFIGSGWDRPSSDVRVVVRLPGSIPAGQIRAWAHGPLHGEVRPVPGGATLEVRSLPAFTMVEGRVVFPTAAVRSARKREPIAALPRILQEEGRWAAQANRQRLQQRLLIAGLAAIPLLAIGFWLLSYLRFGREPEPAPPEGYYRELPATYTPAELGALWRFGAIQPADFVATIVDLVRRGHIRVSGGRDGAHDDFTLTRTEKDAGLRDFESSALSMLFGSGASRAGNTVTVGGRQGLPSGVKERVGRQFSAWKSLVSHAAREHAFFDPTSQRMSRIIAVVGGVLIVGGWVVATGVQPLGGFSTVAAGVVLALGSGAVKRRSQGAADDLRRWQGFRRFLLDFSEMPKAELPSLTLWEHYLVYAIPLGVADQVIRQLRELYPVQELARSPGLQPWIGSSSAGRGNALAGLSSFTTSLAAATSSASSGGGRGGGFSGGGGGGGGGSSGSAG
jgi:uncharacterized membrane protein